MIREYEANMPPEIMTLIKSFDWKKEMRAIVNQNQLMIDIGSDIEESVYLMILGVIQVADLYERLTDTHNMPEDKARKVIEEIEMTIFNPLHQKLMALEAVETKNDTSLTQTATRLEVPIVEPTRDDILAEIEKEPEAIVIPITKSEPVVASTTPAFVEDDARIAKPFSLSQSKEIEMEMPAIEMPKPIEGIQSNPVTVGLQQPTVMQAKPVSEAPTKSYAADPYREPIE